MKTLEELAREYKQYKRLEDELEANLNAIAKNIKAMVPAGAPVLAGEYKVSLTTVSQSRIDATALRRDMPDVAGRYSKTSTYDRLTVD